MTRRREWIRAVYHRCCPLCADEKSVIVSHRMQHRLDLDTVVCTGCGFVFTNPLPDRQTYERFYVEAYAQYYGHIALRPAGQARVSAPDFLRRRLDQIESVQPLAGARVLEVGPGQGLFLWWARSRGSSILGVEPSPEFCQALTEDGLPCIHGSLEQARLPDDQGAGMVAMFHVLEHFYDPNRALNRCRSLIKDGGLLVVELPNILKPFRSLDRFFLRYVHPSSFSPSTLRAMLNKHGFEIAFEDEGTGDWREPQNLFVIARKLAAPPGKLVYPEPKVDEVLRDLRRYRLRWQYGLSWAWYTHRWWSRMRRPMFSAARYLKRAIRLRQRQRA
jgi:SAM-dependent methyltransferase